MIKVKSMTSLSLTVDTNQSAPSMRRSADESHDLSTAQLIAAYGSSLNECPNGR